MCFHWQFATIIIMIAYFEDEAETEKDKFYKVV